MVISQYIFEFIKYIKPGWYFNLPSTSKHAYWVDYRQLGNDLKCFITFDGGYSSENSSLRDAAYQALSKGIVLVGDEYQLDLRGTKPSVADNYRFIRKYFSLHWLFYILAVRLLTFHNPIAEISGFYAAIKKQSPPLSDIRSGVVWIPRDFKSKLIEREPKVSVIIPTLNRYDYLHDVMLDLQEQDYKNFEVIVCDQSDNVDVEFYKRYRLDITLLTQQEKALWLARNRCVHESKGDYLLFFDDDSRVDPDWIRRHLECLDFFDVEVSSGVSLSKVGAEIPADYSYYKWSAQLDTGNALIDRNVFSRTGLFDRQFEKQRMGDGEFGLRCYLSGVGNISNPLAKRIHLKAETGGLRQFGAWDAFRNKGFFSPSPVPSVLYLHRKYFGNKPTLLLLLQLAPAMLIPYRLKSSRAAMLFSWVLALFLGPVVVVRMMRSWGKSSKMLKDGSKIEQVG